MAVNIGLHNKAACDL